MPGTGPAPHRHRHLRGFIDDLKSRIDIVAAVSSHVRLMRRGGTLRGLCPFHNGDESSLVVYPERGAYRCYGCGERGDVLQFLRKLRFGDDFMGMLRVLGEEHGMPLPPTGTGGDSAAERPAANDGGKGDLAGPEDR